MLEPRIRVFWSAKDYDLKAAWDAGCASQDGGYLLFLLFNKTFLEALDERGYDIKTLRFQIRKKPPNALDRIVNAINEAEEKV